MMPYTTINSIKLHYKLEGEGFPVILIHGFSDDLNYWNGLSKILIKNHKVLSMDLRGHGESSMGDEMPSHEKISENIFILAKRLNIEKADVIGFSLGGNVSLELAKNHPEFVNKLILLSTYGKADENLKEKFNIFNDKLNESFESYYDEIIPYILPKEFIDKNKDILNENKKEKSKIMNCENLKKMLKIGIEFDIVDELNKIKSETLIIVSKNDILTLPKLSKELNEKIENSKLILLDYGMHNIFIRENLNRIDNLILNFIS